MNKQGLSIIFFAVLGGSIAWWLSPHADTRREHTPRQATTNPLPDSIPTQRIGLDSDGAPAVCDELGVAFNYSGGSIPTIEPRIKEGTPVTCMSKHAAEQFLLTIGSDRAAMDLILVNYPVFTPKIQ